jgi:hypothetical protein
MTFPSIGDFSLISIHAAHAGSDIMDYFRLEKLEEISIHAAHAGSDE